MKTVMITNTGISDLSIAAIALAVKNAKEFSEANSCTKVSQGSSCAITVTFHPASDGSKNAIMSISSNDPKKDVIKVKLRGSGNG
jgi:hypothetical protein